MKTKKLLLGFFSWITCSYSGFSQGVGINTEQPQATLHVAGTVRIDTLGDDLDGVFPTVSVDSHGDLKKRQIDTTGSYIKAVYGEDILLGDAVAIGDGITGYQSIDQSINTGTITVPSSNWIAQTFLTSNSATGIRAVGISSTSAITTFRARIRDVSSGVPTGPDLGSVTYFHNNNSHGTFVFVFNPPIIVLPNHQYALIIDVSNQVKPDYSSTNVYLGGNRLQTSDSGVTWVSYPSHDWEFQVFETQTTAGLLYKARTQSGTLTPLAVSFFNSSTTTFGPPDRMNNFVGFSRQSGLKGATGKVSVGPICINVPNTQAGRSYWLSASPGVLSSQSVSPEKFVGLALPGSKFFIMH